mgnify:CR=1 FL=1|tara:strand:+ start:1290 stop:1520 length:231 start_codon:yes stop_codon:yes gene_type:complete
MTTSKYIKSKGLPSIEETARLSHTPVNTINNWYKSRRDRLDVLLDGAMLRYIDEQFVSSGLTELEFSQKIIKILKG